MSLHDGWPVVEDHRYTEQTLSAAVYRWLTDADVAVFAQVAAPPVEQDGRPVSRVIDLVALSPRRTTHEPAVVAFEVKVTRQDFLADVRRPAKQAPWVEAAHQHFYVTPLGLVRDEEVPATSGLLEVARRVTPYGEQVDTVSCRFERDRATGEAPSWLTHGLLMRSAATEAYHARWIDSLGDLGSVHAELAAANGRVAAAENALARAKADAEAWKMLAARQGHKVPCATCGAAIVPTRISGGVPAGWRHAQPHLTTECAGNQRGVRPREDSTP